MENRHLGDQEAQESALNFIKNKEQMEDKVDLSKQDTQKGLELGMIEDANKDLEEVSDLHIDREGLLGKLIESNNKADSELEKNKVKKIKEIFI